MRFFSVVIAALALLGLMTGVATVAMAETLENIADAYVARNNAGTLDNSNNGSSPKVFVKNDMGNTVNKAYGKFDLSTVTTDRTSATFEITQALTYGVPEGQPAVWVTEVYALDDNATGQDWNESTITYNNAPANINSAGVGAFPETEFFDLNQSSVVGSYIFDVNGGVVGTVYSFSSAALLAAVNNDTDNLLTLMLTSTTFSGGGQHLASKEHATLLGMRLVLGPEVPEPGTFCLLGIGWMFLVGYRRRSR